MPRDAIAELDRLLIEDPFGRACEEALIVGGDLLQSRGLARGELIALELALAAAPTRGERELQEGRLHAWLEHHEALMFGSLGWLREPPSAIRFGVRGGRLSWLYLDARRALQRGAGLSMGELMQAVVGARAVRRIRELRVRVRDGADGNEALAAIERAGRKLPLEVLLISPTTRPLGHYVRGHAGDLRKRFPHLWLATRHGRLVSLLDPELADETTAHELRELAGAPMSEELRIRIGRGLGSGREHTTKAACELLAGLGRSARVFVPTLRLLLRPQVSHAAAWILPALPRLGAWADELLPDVRRITGGVARYPSEIRKLAGHCVRELERRPV